MCYTEIVPAHKVARGDQVDHPHTTQSLSDKETAKKVEQMLEQHHFFQD